MFQRLQDAIAAGQSAVTELEQAELRKTAAWIVLDEIGRDADPMRSRFLALAKGDSCRPLFFLSALTEVEQSNPSQACEFIPLSEDIAEATGERPDVIALHLGKRLVALFSKWNVQTCYWTGDRAGELIACAREEPAFSELDIRILPL